MQHLSLFTGAGGGELATTHLLGWNTVGYVERQDYCQQVIAARIRDGYLHEAPIFSNIDTFISDGYAGAYKGLVDVITAGFPCQGWSSIGKHAGTSDGRNKWPETLEAVRIIRPRFVMLENSPNIMGKGFIFEIIDALSSLGYVGHATRLSGLHVGAHSKRERAWIKAELSDTPGERLQGRDNGTEERETTHRSVQRLGKNKLRLDLPDPGAFRVNHGCPRRVDRTRAVGNMQIPAVAALAWQLL